MIEIDPSLFTSEAVSEETEAFNAKLLALIEGGPDPWTLPTDVVRAARRTGRGPFPLEASDPTAMMIEAGHGGLHVPLRIIKPNGDRAGAGTFLHIHGGGWMYGASDLQDQRLKRIANATGMTCVSVEYRLTPENPWPAGMEDCHAAAAWLVDGEHDLETSFLAIGGESAGAHLSALVLQQLIAERGQSPFQACVMIAGAYDMAMTPSAAGFDKRLVLSARDIRNFRNALKLGDLDYRDPSISPLYGEMTGLPPAHFSIGTADALLDDTLFMAAKWAQAQPDVELDIKPGGCHVFHYFEDLAITRESDQAVFAFLNRLSGQDATT